MSQIQGARTDWLSARARSFHASGPCDLSATVAATTCADRGGLKEPGTTVDHVGLPRDKATRV